MSKLIVAALVLCFSVISTCSNAQSSRSDYLQVQKINELIREVWQDYDIRPSKDATEEEWCRRLYLDLLGRIPTHKELQKFVRSDHKDKERELVNKLLFDDEYTEEYARNWTTIWANLLIGRTGGTGNNTLISRPGMQKFLRDSFARNKPFDQFTSDLITATGSTIPGAKDFNGATNYLIDKINDDKASQATSTTSRIFMGLQVQCTQCHNHPFNDWKQQKYWEMNAFFRQTRSFRGGRMDTGQGARLADQDFAGENEPRNLREPAIFYELRNGEMRVAYPVFIDGTAIERSGYVKKVNRRQELARLVIDSTYFPKAIANRVWSHFLGYGFTIPVDDLGPHNPPSHPELLDYLGEQFRQSDFDYRKLISWIVLSKPYRLSSKLGKYNEVDDPLLGETPKFSRFYLRQMRAEELYESLLVANQASSGGDYEEKERQKNRWLQQFSQAFGTDEGDETTTFNGTIPQVLMMFNGEMIRSATGDAKGSMIMELTESNLSYQRKIDYLFKAGLSRKPKRSESQMARQFIQFYEGNEAEALRDVWWVILNSNEFIFNH
ncbi:MAG: DUF1549 domain-containing protein [Planctomycetota bacterium]